MKKILLSFICCLMPFVCCSADYEHSYGSGVGYNITDATKAAWGYPSVVTTSVVNTSVNYGKFRIQDGWACCGSGSSDEEKIKYAQTYGNDDQAIMAFVANIINEHGALFCLTQIHVGSSKKPFHLYYQRPYRPELQCAWFCEPGWDGDACSERTNQTATCNTVNYSQEISRIKTSKYPNPDSITLHQMCAGFAQNVGLLDAAYVSRFPHEIVVGAVDFMEHGIVAKPIVLAAVGNHPRITQLITSEANSGTQKVLCAQGFTADDKCNISSSNCGKSIWCDTEVGKYFNSKIHIKQTNGYCDVFVCKDALTAFDDNFNCVSCQGTGKGRCNVSGKPDFGKCIECANGQFFDSTNCTCVQARQLTKFMMKYGKNRSDDVSEQCWTKEDSTSYENCVMSAVE